MQLTDDQKKQVATWVQGGAGLSEIQKKLTEELGISLTYMDVRFLILDLGLEIRNKAVKAPPPPPPPAASEEPLGDVDAFASDAPVGSLPPSGPGGSVSVELDRLTKPGTVVSGTVTFSDGVTAAWSLDQFGRLALNPQRPGYQPSPGDIQAFQVELRRALERRGF